MGATCHTLPEASAAREALDLPTGRHYVSQSLHVGLYSMVADIHGRMVGMRSVQPLSEQLALLAPEPLSTGTETCCRSTAAE